MFSELWAIAESSGHILAGFWWYVVAAILIASVMSTFKLEKKVIQLFHRSGKWAITVALLLGLVSPL